MLNRMLVLVLVVFAACVSAQVVVKKEFVSSSNGVYTISVAYKKGTGGAVSDVKIRDTLPEHLELVSGKLTSDGPVPTKEYFANIYSVRVVDYEFSLQNRTAEFQLAAATISFVKEDGSEGSTKSNPLTLTVKGPVIPQGEVDQPLVIFALTIVLPVLAAYFGINFFHARGSGAPKRKAE